VAKDPSAWLKYQNDPEVKSYFAKMMGLFGQQYEEHEQKNEKNGQQPKQGKEKHKCQPTNACKQAYKCL
jgi:hypothetical protein